MGIEFPANTYVGEPGLYSHPQQRSRTGTPLHLYIACNTHSHWESMFPLKSHKNLQMLQSGFFLWFPFHRLENRSRSPLTMADASWALTMCQALLQMFYLCSYDYFPCLTERGQQHRGMRHTGEPQFDALVGEIRVSPLYLGAGSLLTALGSPASKLLFTYKCDPGQDALGY